MKNRIGERLRLKIRLTTWSTRILIVTEIEEMNNQTQTRFLPVVIRTAKDMAILGKTRQFIFQLDLAICTFQALDVPAILGDHQKTLIIDPMTTTTASVSFTAG